MSKTDRFAAERRRFLAEGALYGAGAVSILAELGLAGCVTPKQTSSAPPAPTRPSDPPAAANGAAPARPMMPPMPPEPAVSQAAPLHDLKGKVAYITASSDGI